jgi:hypothetical protein
LQRQKEYPGKTTGYPARFPFLCELSRTGRFFFEAGDEKLRLSRVDWKP